MAEAAAAFGAAANVVQSLTIDTPNEFVLHHTNLQIYQTFVELETQFRLHVTKDEEVMFIGLRWTDAINHINMVFDDLGTRRMVWEGVRFCERVLMKPEAWES